MMFLLAQTLWEWILESEGYFIYPQLPLAVITLGLILSALELSRLRPYGSRNLRKHLKKETLSRENIAGDRSPLAQAISAGLAAEERGESPEVMRYEVERSCEGVAIGVERRLGVIAALAQAAVMTGLLGTVVGLMGSFRVISQQGESPPVNELAGGVSQALMTTIFGLVTAIPAFIMLAVLRWLADRLLYRLESIAIDSVQRLKDS